MRSKKGRGRVSNRFLVESPEWSLFPLVRPDIAMDPESQIEAWSPGRLRRLTTVFRINRSRQTDNEKHRCQTQPRLIIAAGPSALLTVLGDSDVMTKDTEVGKTASLTSPFIEGI
jgi:hypothetical protein